MLARIPIFLSIAVVLTAAAAPVPTGKVTVADCENAEGQNEKQPAEAEQAEYNPFENFIRLVRAERASRAGLCEI